MKRLMILPALAALAAAVSACERPSAPPPPTEPVTVDMNAPVAEDPNAIPVDGAAVEATASTTGGEAVPVDDTTLPPNKRSSEASVQPDSETLFY